MMNRALPEMLHCLNTSGSFAGGGNGTTDMTVLERQRARMKWQHEEEEQFQLHHQQQGGGGTAEESYFSGNEYGNVFSMQSQLVTQTQQIQALINGDHTVVLDQAVNQALKSDPGLENRWKTDYEKFQVVRTGFDGESLDFESCGYGNGTGFSMNYGVGRTTSCPSEVVAAAAAMAETEVADGKGGQESVLTEKMSLAIGRENFKKRKADKVHNSKVVAEDDMRDKRIKGCTEEVDSKITEHNSKNNNNGNRENSGDTSKETSKVSEVQKPDYIHVRARRGQATDSHSLAERVRREKISERMKYLQDLVPGCNKITGKAGMLDEIINYVQSLQRQVEFLSMKLAAVNPRLDINIENFFAKEVFPACTASYQTIGMSSSEMANPTSLQFNPLQQLMSSCGMEMGINTPDMGFLRRTISAPVSIPPEPFLDTSCFAQIQPPSSTWDADLQNLYSLEFQQAGRSTSFPSQPFTGSIEASNLKMEM